MLPFDDLNIKEIVISETVFGTKIKTITLEKRIDTFTRDEREFIEKFLVHNSTYSECEISDNEFMFDIDLMVYP